MHRSPPDIPAPPLSLGQHRASAVRLENVDVVGWAFFVGRLGVAIHLGGGQRQTIGQQVGDDLAS